MSRSATSHSVALELQPHQKILELLKCPVTERYFDDPVCLPCGDTVERKLVSDRGGYCPCDDCGEEYAPSAVRKNFAVKSIVDVLIRYERFERIDDLFCCPVERGTFYTEDAEDAAAEQAVIMCCDHTFLRRTAENWWTQCIKRGIKNEDGTNKMTCPVDAKEVVSTELYSNNLMTDLSEAFKKLSLIEKIKLYFRCIDKEGDVYKSVAAILNAASTEIRGPDAEESGWAFDVNVKFFLGDRLGGQIETTLLHQAVIQKRSEVLAWLCNQEDLDRNVEDNNGKTALEYASERARMTVLSEGYNALSLVGKRALHVKSIVEDRHVQERVIAILSVASFEDDCAIDINMKFYLDDYSDSRIETTLLHQAVMQAEPVVLTWLCEQGDLDRNAEDSNGKTALYYAEEQENLDAISQLNGGPAVQPVDVVADIGVVQSSFGSGVELAVQPVDAAAYVEQPEPGCGSGDAIPLATLGADASGESQVSDVQQAFKSLQSGLTDSRWTRGKPDFTLLKTLDQDQMQVFIDSLSIEKPGEAKAGSLTACDNTSVSVEGGPRSRKIVVVSALKFLHALLNDNTDDNALDQVLLPLTTDDDGSRKSLNIRWLNFVFDAIRHSDLSKEGQRRYLGEVRDKAFQWHKGQITPGQGDEKYRVQLWKLARQQPVFCQHRDSNFWNNLFRNTQTVRDIDGEIRVLRCSK